MRRLLADFTANVRTLERSPPLARRAARSARFFRGMTIAAILALVLLAAGFVRFIVMIEYAPQEAEAPRADGIVVLTGGHSRIETGVDLLRQGKGGRLLISGVHPDTSLAQIRRAVGAKADIFRCCVDIDKAALDTVGNAEQAADWARRNHFASLIVVTSYYHMPRSLLEMRRKLPGIEIHSRFVRPESGSGRPWFFDPEALRVVVPEYLKYVAALLRLGVREANERQAMASAISF